MPRYKLTLEYDGGPFVGWQRQENGPSVQAAIEAAIEKFCQERVTAHAAGRTDAGVHALGQVIHVDLERQAPADTVRDAVNYHLKPDPIAVLSVEVVDDAFHARFSALRRHYLFRIVDRRPPLALERGRAWHVPQPLDAALMHEAAQELVGRHDFSTFRAVGCQAKSALKTLDDFDVARIGDEIHVTARARSFLHRQVRSMVGSLKLVGDGSWVKAHLRDALAARDRAACGPVAPPHGLYLLRVDYPSSVTSDRGASTDPRSPA